MSSPKVAAKTARRGTTGAKTKVISAKPQAGNTGVSADAINLAKDIDRAFKQSDLVLSEDAMQTLMGALCRVYAAQVESGAKYTPITEGQVVSPTAVMVTYSASGLAGNLAVFELMWRAGPVAELNLVTTFELR
jgi:hypothetical protein